MLASQIYATDHDGKQVNPLKPLAKSQRRLRVLSRRHSKKRLDSKNRRKASKKLTKLHYRVTCQRRDFIHKNSTILAKTKSVIGGESLNIAGMLQNHSSSEEQSVMLLGVPSTSS